jgi:hypothetical protein
LARFNHIHLKARGALAAMLRMVRQAINRVDEPLRPSNLETLNHSQI